MHNVAIVSSEGLDDWINGDRAHWRISMRQQASMDQDLNGRVYLQSLDDMIRSGLSVWDSRVGTHNIFLMNLWVCWQDIWNALVKDESVSV